MEKCQKKLIMVAGYLELQHKYIKMELGFEYQKKVFY